MTKINLMLPHLKKTLKKRSLKTIHYDLFTRLFYYGEAYKYIHFYNDFSQLENNCLRFEGNQYLGDDETNTNIVFEEHMVIESAFNIDYYNENSYYSADCSSLIIYKTKARYGENKSCNK